MRITGRMLHAHAAQTIRWYELTESARCAWESEAAKLLKDMEGAALSERQAPGNPSCHPAESFDEGREIRTAADTDPVVGHKTFREGNGFRHEPLRQSEADVLMAAIEAADEKRKQLMPDEDAAVHLFFDAWLRLKDFGWREATYCPKDGTEFEVIEAGSTGRHRCIYQGEWPKGTWWILEEGDMSPSRPVLFRALPASPDKGAGAAASKPSEPKKRGYLGSTVDGGIDDHDEEPSEPSIDTSLMTPEGRARWEAAPVGPSEPPSAPQAVPDNETVMRLLDLIGDYWSCAWKEGAAGRHHDDEQGTAQGLWIEIRNRVVALASLPVEPGGKNV
jgi:hypothetical protein